MHPTATVAAWTSAGALAGLLTGELLYLAALGALAGAVAAWRARRR